MKKIIIAIFLTLLFATSSFAAFNAARRVGFSEAYLWGVEWWYWLKETKGEPAVWDTARELFRAKN